MGNEWPMMGNKWAGKWAGHEPMSKGRSILMGNWPNGTKGNWEKDKMIDNKKINFPS
jgi:hypothetical protein